MTARIGGAYFPIEWYDADGQAVRIPAGSEDAGRPPLRFEVRGIEFEWNSASRKMLFIAGTPANGDVDPEPDTVAVRGSSGELFANNFRAGPTGAPISDISILTAVNIQIGSTSTSSIAKAQPSSGPGGALSIRAAKGGVAGQIGGDFTYGAGDGGDEGIDAPGTTIAQLGSSSSGSGLHQWRADSSYGLFLDLQFVQSDSSVRWSTTKNIIRFDAGTSYEFRTASTSRLTIDNTGLNIPTGATYKRNGIDVIGSRPKAARINVTTTNADDSGAWSDLLTVAYTSTRSELSIDAYASLENVTPELEASFRVTIDGSPVAFAVASSHAAPPKPFACSIVHLESGVSAGPHTIKLQWKPRTGSGDTLTIEPANDEGAALRISESDPYA